MAPPRFSLAGKTALVTGGSRGIGRAIALALADQGARVAVASRSREALEAVVRAMAPAEGLAVPVDLRDPEQVGAMVGAVLGSFGRIDVLVNSAGVSPAYTSALKLSEEDWHETLEVNLTGPFRTCRAVGRHMVEAGRGSVINVASIGARVGLTRLAAYCASKAGLEALTRVLALEWAGHGVRVNAIGPAFVTTDMSSALLEHPHFGPQLLAQTPLGRFGEAEDVAGAAVYLASDASRYVTGQTLFVDGGWLAR